MDHSFLYKHIFNSSPHPIFIHIIDKESELRLIDANQKALDSLGYTTKDLQVLSPDKYITSDFYRYIISENIESYSYFLGPCFKHKYDKKVLENATLSCYKSDDELYYITSIGKVTDQEDIREALVESKEKLKLSKQQLEFAEESAKIMRNICGLDGTIIQPHPNLCKLTGYTEEDFKLIHFSEFSIPEEWKKEKSLFNQLIEGQIDSYEIEKRILCKNREIKWVYLNCCLIKDKKDNPTQILAYIKDMSKEKSLEKQLRQNQEQYEKLVEILPDGVFISKDGKCLFVNNSAVELLGYNNTTEVVGKNLLEFLHPDCSSDISIRRRHLYSLNKPFPFIEQKVLKKDGSVAVVEAASIPICYEDQTSSLTVTRDITRYKNIAQRLKEANQQLQLYIVENDELLYELRRFRHNYINVLHGMRGYIDDHDWEGLDQYFEYLVGEIRQLKNIHILAVQKIKNLSFRSLLTVKLKEAKTKEINIYVEILNEVDVPNNLMKKIDLCEVMGIFLDNAIEAAQESESPQLNCCIYDDKESITIIIENSYGIEPNLSLLKSSYTTKGKNRGVGLSLSAQILSQYPNILNNTFIKDGFFVQELQINK